MKHSTAFICNDQKIKTNISPGTVVLDFLRDHLFLHGTKAACREGDCGSCTVLLGGLSAGSDRIEYQALTSCLLPLGEAAGKHLVSIEGVNPLMETTLSDIPLRPIQRIFVEEGATQCGFCTPGFIMSLTGFLLQGAPLTYERGLDSVAGNICRCTGYGSIKRCVSRLVNEYGPKLEDAEDTLDALIAEGIVPTFFKGIPDRLKQIDAASGHGAEDPGNASGHEVIVAGGTDLYVQKPENMPEADIRFASRQAELTGIEIREKKCRIGAGTTMEALKNSTVFGRAVPGFDGFADLIASKQIRTRATIGGNIINASPIGDFSVLLLALEAELGIRKNGGPEEKGNTRMKTLKDFYLGYKTFDLLPGEYLAFIEFEIPSPEDSINFEKVARRTHLDIASVNTGIKIETVSEKDGGVIHRAAVSAGGVAPVPLFLEKTSSFLQGKKLEPDVILSAAKTANGEISPISDVRGSAEYKTLLFRQLFFTHFLTLFPKQFGPGGLI